MSQLLVAKFSILFRGLGYVVFTQMAGVHSSYKVRKYAWTKTLNLCYLSEIVFYKWKAILYFVTIHELILYVLAVTSFMVICNHNYWRNNVSFVKAYIMIVKMSLHMKWLITLFTSCMVYFMICFIVVFVDYHLSEVFGTYLT